MPRRAALTLCCAPHLVIIIIIIIIISETMKHIFKIPTTTTVSGSAFLVVVLPISLDADVCYKSKTAAELPEVITLLVLQVHMSFQNDTGVYNYVRNI